jgi:hypothetical protein
MLHGMAAPRATGAPGPDEMREDAPLYPDDAYAWSLAQAGALRRLRATGLPLPNGLDLPMIIEAVGAEQLHAVESHLIQALRRLLKLAAMPASDAALHWQAETRAFLSTASRRYRPSMRRALRLERVWKDVRKQAADEFALMGAAVPALPPDCPLTLDALVDEEAEPRALAAQLAAALGLPPPSGRSAG